MGCFDFVEFNVYYYIREVDNRICTAFAFDAYKAENHTSIPYELIFFN